MEISKALYKRAGATGRSMRSLMVEAGVEPNLASRWNKKQPVSWEKWLKLLTRAGVEIADPGVSTWKTVVKAMGNKEDALRIFMDSGYQTAEVNARWIKRDAVAVENYKKVLSVIKRYEKPS